MRSSGAAGSTSTTTDSAVRITHLPTGLLSTSSENHSTATAEIAIAGAQGAFI